VIDEGPTHSFGSTTVIPVSFSWPEPTAAPPLFSILQPTHSMPVRLSFTDVPVERIPVPDSEDAIDRRAALPLVISLPTPARLRCRAQASMSARGSMIKKLRVMFLQARFSAARQAAARVCPLVASSVR
jgi:hypothetical protein